MNEEFLIEDGVLVEYTGPGGDVIVPEGVTGIDDSVFYDCHMLSSITIPSSVKEIGSDVFLGCPLSDLILPDSVTTLGDYLTDSVLREFQADGLAVSALEAEEDEEITSDVYDELLDSIMECYEVEREEAEEIFEEQEEQKRAQNEGRSVNGNLVGPLLRNFARRRLNGDEIQDTVVANRMEYIQTTLQHIDRSAIFLFREAVRLDDSLNLLRLLFREGLIERKDVQLLLDTADELGSTTVKATVLELVHQNSLLIEPSEN